MSSNREYANSAAAGGWADNSGFWRLSPSGNSPSPSPADFPASHFATFRFIASPTRGWTDQSVVGTGQTILFRVVSNRPLQTVIANGSTGAIVASIEWRPIPVFDRGGRRFTAPEWIRSVTGAGNMRAINIRGTEYYWSYDNRRFFIHEGRNLQTPYGMVRMSSTGLEIRLPAPDWNAARLEILENCILALILLQGPSCVGL